MVDAPTCETLPSQFSQKLNQGYTFTSAYPYSALDGEILFWRIRLDHPTKGKYIRPIHLDIGDVFEPGEPDLDAHGKPLYGLPLLAANPLAHVWIVEGEKCVDTLNEFFHRHAAQQQHIAVTSGSATSADKADWTPLQSREVWIWPDHDASGQSYNQAVITQLEAIGSRFSGTLDCLSIGLGDGEDCVEWFERNPDADLARLLALPVILPENDVTMVCMDDIEMKPIEWLWPDRIACGKLTVIAGNPGLGKSQLSAALAAIVTTGGEWPNGEGSAPPGSAIFLSAEDDPADTIKPRLVAAGANLRRCHMLTAVRAEAGEGKATQRAFDLARDIARLSDAVEKLGDVRLIIIDPISAYLGKTDSNNNSEMRGLLMPLAEMACKYRLAMVVLTHLNKSTQQDAIGKIIGSIGLIAAARSGYLVTRNEDDHSIRYFVPVKNNIGNDRDGFSYSIEGVTLANGIETSKISWHPGWVSAQSILHPEPKKKAGATTGAADFLREILASGPMNALDVFDAGKGNGYSKAALQRAKKWVGVKVRKLGMAGSWEWYIPSEGDDIPEDAEGCEDEQDYAEPSSNPINEFDPVTEPIPEGSI